MNKMIRGSRNFEAWVKALATKQQLPVESRIIAIIPPPEVTTGLSSIVVGWVLVIRTSPVVPGHLTNFMNGF